MVHSIVLAAAFSLPLSAQAAAQMPNRCASNPVFELGTTPAWNGWGGDASNTRYQPASAARLTTGNIPKLKLKWAFGLPGAQAVSGQPTVAAGRVLVSSDNGFVYSLDAA